MGEYFTEKQYLIACDVFEGRMNHQQLMKKHRIKSGTLKKLLAKKRFKEELRKLGDKACEETQLTLSRFGPVAAMKLAELLGSDKPDVSRRAALDMIDRCMAGKQEEKSEVQGRENNISDKKLQGLLAKLARAFGKK